MSEHAITILIVIVSATIGGIMGQRYLNKNKKDDSEQKS